MKGWQKTLGRLAAILALLALIPGIFAWWWLTRFTVTEIKAPADSMESAWPTSVPGADDWPWWRGRQRNGQATGQAPPIHWSTSKNILWKKEVPGRGHASPIVWGDQVFIYTADEQEQKIFLLAYQRKTGQELWRVQLLEGGFIIKHAKNSHASSTPACDGKHVYTVSAINDSIYVIATNLNGSVAWAKYAGPFLSENGYGSSPLIWGPYVIVAADSSPLSLRRFSSSPSFLAALNRLTGQIVWRVRRPLGHSYGTPIIASLYGREQLLLSGQEAVYSYDPLNGTENWKYPWPASRTTNTVAAFKDRLIATTTLPSRLTVCLRGDGKGVLDESHLLWKSERYVCDVPSPLITPERLYLVEDSGIATCLASADGKLLWKGRLGSGETVSASPVMFQKTIYAAAESGKTYVFEDGPAFRLLATNDLGEEQIATPAIAGGDIFIRTSQHLWCISEQKPEGKP